MLVPIVILLYALLVYLNCKEQLNYGGLITIFTIIFGLYIMASFLAIFIKRGYAENTFLFTWYDFFIIVCFFLAIYI